MAFIIIGHWAAVVSSGWANALACRLQVSLSCAVLCQIVSLQYLSRPSLHRLAGLPCRLFVSWSQSGDTQSPSVVFKAVDMPCPGTFHFSHIADYKYIYDFCLLTDPDVGLSIFVCDVEHTSFHFGLALSHSNLPSRTQIRMLKPSSVRDGAQWKRSSPFAGRFLYTLTIIPEEPANV